VAQVGGAKYTASRKEPSPMSAAEPLEQRQQA
jgi:hypothetical protein